MEAYSVWASLNLKGNALEQMGKFLAITKEVNESLSFLYKNISLLDDQLMASSASLKGLSSGFALLKTESAESLTAFDVSLSSSLKQVSALTTKTASLAAAMGTLKESSAGAALMGAGAVSGGSRGGRHYGMHGLNEMGMGEVAKPASALMGASMLGGPLAMGAAGVGILAYKGFESQKDYQMKLSQLSALGLGDDYTSKLNDIAQNTQITGISKTKMIEAVVDAQMATRAGPSQIREVQMMAPALAKGALQSELMFGHGMTDAQKKDLVRFAEIQGGSAPEKQLQWLRAGINMMITSGGTINPAKQLKFSQQSSGSLHLTPEAFLALEPVLQELQSRTSVGLSTGVTALAGNVSMAGFSKKNLDFWNKIGLLHEGKMENKSKLLLMSDSPAWFKDVLFPTLNKAGYKTDDEVNTALLNFPKTFRQVASASYKNLTKTDRARAMSRHVLGSDEIDETLKKNPSFAVSHLATAWENFSLTFGKFSSPASVLAINLVSRALESLTVVMQAFGKSISFLKSMDAKIDSFIPHFDPKNLLNSSNENKDKMGSPYKSSQTKAQEGHIIMDGKKVGNVIFPHFTNALHGSGTTASTGAFNSSLSMAPVGLSNYGNQQ